MLVEGFVGYLRMVELAVRADLEAEEPIAMGWGDREVVVFGNWEEGMDWRIGMELRWKAFGSDEIAARPREITCTTLFPIFMHSWINEFSNT